MSEWSKDELRLRGCHNTRVRTGKESGETDDVGEYTKMVEVLSAPTPTPTTLLLLALVGNNTGRHIISAAINGQILSTPNVKRTTSPI